MQWEFYKKKSYQGVEQCSCHFGYVVKFLNLGVGQTAYECSTTELFPTGESFGSCYCFSRPFTWVDRGVFTGVGLKHLIGDPLVSGLESLLFYGAFGGSSLITLFVMLNYLMMSLRVSGEGIAIQRGMKSAMLDVDVIVAVRVAETRSRMSRAASEATKPGKQVSQMWSVMGIGSGLRLISWVQKTKVQTWFISSNDLVISVKNCSR
ncbi:MAG: hypothetical protein Ct9H300mP19_04420 [Dehalococcoidia bacterium]|nr:MAG: hypothetical protein Ct9H300mP19_04420 [Dehalococcoidia bacterium]